MKVLSKIDVISNFLLADRTNIFINISDEGIVKEISYLSQAKNSKGRLFAEEFYFNLFSERYQKFNLSIKELSNIIIITLNEQTFLLGILQSERNTAFRSLTKEVQFVLVDNQPDFVYAFDGLLSELTALIDDEYDVLISIVKEFDKARNKRDLHRIFQLYRKIYQYDFAYNNFVLLENLFLLYFRKDEEALDILIRNILHTTNLPCLLSEKSGGTQEFLSLKLKIADITAKMIYKVKDELTTRNLNFNTLKNTELRDLLIETLEMEIKLVNIQIQATDDPLKLKVLKNKLTEHQNQLKQLLGQQKTSFVPQKEQKFNFKKLPENTVQKFRELIKKFHPDVVRPELKKMAQTVTDVLINAYGNQDSDTIEEIYKELDEKIFINNSKNELFNVKIKLMEILANITAYKLGLQSLIGTTPAKFDSVDEAIEREKLLLLKYIEKLNQKINDYETAKI